MYKFMEEFDSERCCPVCLWTGESRVKLVKHMRYMHADVYVHNLTPYDKGYRYLAEESGVPRCQVCRIFVGIEFESVHRGNTNHLNNLAHQHQLLEKGSPDSVSFGASEMQNENEEAYYDPERGGDSDGGAGALDGDESSVSYEDACDFLEDRQNSFTAEDWSSGSSDPVARNDHDMPDLSVRLGVNASLDFLGQLQNLPYEKKHVGETYLSCVEVTVDGVSSLDLNTRDRLEQRAFDWREWRTVCVIDTSETPEVCLLGLSLLQQNVCS